MLEQKVKVPCGLHQSLLQCLIDQDGAKIVSPGSDPLRKEIF